MVQDRCWLMKGKTSFFERTGKRQKRYNLFCAINHEFKPILPFITLETCRAVNFERWFESLLWELQENAVIIMDNARFHRKEFLFNLIQTFNDWYNRNITILFLPPYSPDLNPIEKFFAVTKAKIKRCREVFECFEDKILCCL